MFIVTNRQVNEHNKGFDIFGMDPNPKGPNELRLVEATKLSRGWRIELLPDEIGEAKKREVNLQRKKRVIASEYAAAKVLDRIRSGRRNLLFFVHGFNNDVKAVLERAHAFEKNYNVEVVAFSWPANGGGLRGAMSYKDDKRDARASAGALDRTLGKMYQALDGFNKERIEEIQKKAVDKFPEDLELRLDYVTRMMERGCPFKICLVAHSMGNYLYKNLLKSTTSDAGLLLFDNVVLVAADTNNEGHAGWVDRIQCRRQIYVTINENDGALSASRIKGGEEQKARLGHYLHSLNSTQAAYVDVTNAPGMKNSHAYFEGLPVKNRNSRLATFFRKIFNGERGEGDLWYHTDRNLYSFGRPR